MLKNHNPSAFDFSSASLTSLGDDVIRGTQRSLDFIKKIDDTISQLCYDQSVFTNVANFARRAAIGLQNNPSEKPIDPAGAVDSVLSTAQQNAEKLYNALVAYHESAANDARLTEDDGVADEFAKTASIVKEMHNALNDLRWAVNEHDADLEKPEAIAFTSADELKKYLASI